MTEDEHINALIRSNDTLRAAVLLAGKELANRKIVGNRHQKMLDLMRDAVREGPTTVRAAKGLSKRCVA